MDRSAGNLFRSMTVDIAILNSNHIQTLSNPFNLFTGAFVSLDSVLHGNIPGPITTREFPFPGGKKPPYLKRSADADRGGDTTACCPICLDPLTCGVCRLFCDHRLHHQCLWGILPVSALGGCTMLRCPMCRATMDRYTLRLLGYDVSVPNLRVVSRGCQDFRDMLHVNPMMGLLQVDGGQSPNPDSRRRMVHRILNTCLLGPADGFLYNVCVLAIDRMIADKRSFATNLRVQVATADACTDVHALVQAAVACHVDVLIHASHVIMDID